MDERQRDVGIEEQAPDDEQEHAAETTGEPAGADPDPIWDADESVGDAASPRT